jgi:uncharacterized protein YbaP (TraB family)
MHLLPPSTPDLPLWALRAYEWSDELVFESEPTALLRYLNDMPSFGLSQHLSEVALAALDSMWPQRAAFPALNDVPPWAALIFGSVLASRVVEGVEAKFLRWAARDGKKVQFLETPAEFQAAVEAAPIQDVIAGIESLIADLSSVQKSLVQMHSAWVGRNLAGIYEAACRSPSFQFPNLRRAVLEIRNRAWAPKLTQLLDSSQRTLVAVGALHLCKPTGVLELLGRESRAVTEKN